jgi:hypothetical protein
MWARDLILTTFAHVVVGFLYPKLEKVSSYPYILIHLGHILTIVIVRIILSF